MSISQYYSVKDVNFLILPGHVSMEMS